MGTQLNFIEGNNFEGIKITIKDRNTNGPLDMLNAFPLTSADLYVYSDNGTTKTLLFTKALDITQKELGILSYTPDATNFDTIGTNYKLEVKLTFTSGKVGRVHGASISIEEQSPITLPV